MIYLTNVQKIILNTLYYKLSKNMESRWTTREIQEDSHRVHTSPEQNGPVITFQNKIAGKQKKQSRHPPTAACRASLRHL